LAAEAKLYINPILVVRLAAQAAHILKNVWQLGLVHHFVLL
jgi:hypothetical protein